MRIRTIHPRASTVFGVFEFKPCGNGLYEGEVPDEAGEALIGLAISQGTNEYARAPEAGEELTGQPPSVEPPIEEDPEEELVDEPDSEETAEKPRRGRRGGSRGV